MCDTDGSLAAKAARGRKLPSVSFLFPRANLVMLSRDGRLCPGGIAGRRGREKSADLPFFGGTNPAEGVQLPCRSRDFGLGACICVKPPGSRVDQRPIAPENQPVTKH